MDVKVYALGIVSASACAPESMPAADVAGRVNALYPTGLDGCPWFLSTDETFKGGEPNPSPCEREPGRIHYLLHC